MVQFLEKEHAQKKTPIRQPKSADHSGSHSGRQELGSDCYRKQRSPKSNP